MLSAVLAAVLIYLFVTHYKKNPTPQVVTPPPATVWEVTRAIPAGTPAAEIAAGGYLKQEQVAAASAVGAITDPSQVVGEVTTTAIAANGLVMADDFTKASGLAGALKGDQRAVAFSFDTEHGLTTWLAAGDTVDVMVVKKGGTELVDQNVAVLENAQGLVVLKLTDRQALLLTAATNKGSLWLSLRPALDATNSIRIYSQGS